MKVALLTNGIWPYVIGGMQKHSYYLVKYFASRGIYVDLYHFNKSEYDISRLEFFTEEEKQYIHAYIIEFPRHRGWPWRYLTESYSYSRALYEQYCKQQPADFIYAKSYTAWYFIKQKRHHSLPPIGIRLHGYEIFQPSRGLLGLYRKKLYMPLVKWLNRKSDYIYSYGGGVTELIVKNIPRSATRIIEVPGGIEPDWVFEGNRLVRSPIRFTFIGRYDIRKGLLELNQALEQIRNSLPFEFSFIGAIPEKLRLNDSKVHYHGELRDKKKIQDILRNTDVLVLPSHSEGMPNVILEAMASGCAILATSVGAVPVMVDERNGWLIPPLSAEAISEKMRLIIQAPAADIESKKVASVKKVKQDFLWNKIIDQEINAIERTKYS